MRWSVVHSSFIDHQCPIIFVFRSNTSSRHTTHVPTLVARPANLLCLVLVSIFKPIWWMSMALICLRAIKRMRDVSVLPSNSKIPLQTPTGAVVAGQVVAAEGVASAILNSHK